MIELLMIEDHALMREGMKQLLKDEGDLRLAGEAATGAAALEFLARAKPELVLLDMNLPDMGGIDLLYRIRSKWPELKVLVLSMHKEVELASTALREGASGYLTKDSPPEILLAAIRKVAAGGRFIDSVLAQEIALDISAGYRRTAPHESLSERESQVLRLYALGKGVSQIARELHLSPKTVSSHKTRLMKRMNIHSNSELVRYALTHGLID